MKCLVCGNQSFEMFHKGTRDNPDIDVMKCKVCGSLQLSDFSQIREGYYEEGNMRKNEYSATDDAFSDQSWNLWEKETEKDDHRRFIMLKDLMNGKRVLDFGCGNGGFLRFLKKENVTEYISGVELDGETHTRLRQKGIDVYGNLNEIETSVKFDVITMFHVIEHLEAPQVILQGIYDRLTDNGILIIETPNADDALISQYHSKSFMDFTFWSAHLFLYCSDSLERLMKDCGYTVVENTQIQRYSLANHLYWLSEQQPGGHMKWNEFDSDALNAAYADVLKAEKKCDTLWGIFKKESGID